MTDDDADDAPPEPSAPPTADAADPAPAATAAAVADPPAGPRWTTRRRFLTGLGALGVAAASGGVLAEVLRGGASSASSSSAASPGGRPGSAADAPTTTAAPRDPGVLVLVTLYGGNDGLNTLVPYADAAYAKGRGDLAIRADEVLRLDAALGLNPGLTGFKELWDAQHLAIVRGVGYPSPNHSHFRSMDIWQSAVPEREEPTGWLGRWLDTLDRDPMRALAVGTSLPRALRGEKSSAGVVPSGSFTLPGSATLGRGYRALGAATSKDDSLLAALQQADHDLLTVQDRLSGATAADTGSGSGASLEPSADLPADNPLATQLAVVSRAIRSGVPTQVYSVSLGGFDTHAAERAAHIALQRTLGDAIAGFVRSLDGHPMASRVVVLAHSEFGRRVAANASGGTDHGTAAPVFVAGQGVRGGFYGEQPSLTDLDDGDLKFTVDFRTVYATLLEQVLVTDPARILGRATATLPFL